MRTRRLLLGLLVALACSEPHADGRCTTDWDCPVPQPNDPSCPVRRFCGPLGICVDEEPPFRCDGTCERAAECPGPFPACEELSGEVCGCATFKVCARGRCGVLTVDCFELDAGMPEPPACFSPADCVGTPESVRFCESAGEAAWSCVDGRCLWECPGGRACKSTDDGPACLSCSAPAGAGPACPPETCPAVSRALTIDDSTCAASTGLALEERLASDTASDCVSTLRLADGSALGRLWPTGGGFLADVPRLGGRCTGEWLPTGAPRLLVACPDCQVVLLGEL